MTFQYSQSGAIKLCYKPCTKGKNKDSWRPCLFVFWESREEPVEIWDTCEGDDDKDETSIDLAYSKIPKSSNFYIINP